MTRHARVLLPALAFLVLGWTWAFASPVGSNADESFHLTSIWCAWGDDETCKLSDDGLTATVPAEVGTVPCFVGKPDVDASCSDQPTSAGLLDTTTFNREIGNYPPVFYSAMRLFVSEDVARSVVMMRMANVALAAAVLALALYVGKPIAARALALTWAVGMVPLGLFNIASVNPGSWAIIGGSTLWVFLYTLLEQPNLRGTKPVLALAGTLVAAFLALARSDQAWVILLSLLAVLALQGRARLARRSTWLVLVSAGVLAAAFALMFNVGRYLTSLDPSWPTGNQLTGQPNPLVRVLAEFPSFLMGHFGAQQPWEQNGTVAGFGVDGWVNVAFLYGLGSPDIVMPSFVGAVGAICVGGLVFLGLTHNSRRKLASIMIVGLGLLLQVLAMRSLADWGSWQSEQGFRWFIYPRYTLPLVLVLLGLTLLVTPLRRPILNRVQALLITVGMVLSSLIALMAVMARFMYGQDQSWLQFELSRGWWWQSGPDPVVLICVAALAALVFFPTMIAYGLPSSRWRQPRSREAAHGLADHGTSSGS